MVSAEGVEGVSETRMVTSDLDLMPTKVLLNDAETALRPHGLQLPAQSQQYESKLNPYEHKPSMTKAEWPKSA